MFSQFPRHRVRGYPRTGQTSLTGLRAKKTILKMEPKEGVFKPPLTPPPPPGTHLLCTHITFKAERKWTENILYQVSIKPERVPITKNNRFENDVKAYQVYMYIGLLRISEKTEVWRANNLLQIYVSGCRYWLSCTFEYPWMKHDLPS